MPRSVNLTVRTSQPCPYKETCPALPNRHMAPGCYENINFCNGVVEEVEVQQYVVKTLRTLSNAVDSLGRFYWQINSIYYSEIVKSQYYNSKYEDLGSDVTEISEFDVEVERILFLRSDEINAMPETTQGEVDAKNLLYGVDFSGVYTERKETIVLA